MLQDQDHCNVYCGIQADTNEVVAASVVYLSKVDVDRPMSKAAWNNSNALRHFSILRKLNGVPFPAGDPFLLSGIIPTLSMRAVTGLCAAILQQAHPEIMRLCS